MPCFRKGGSGALLSELLRKESIAILPVTAREETHQDVTVLETSTQRQYRLVLPGATLYAAEWQECLDHVAKATPKPRYVVGSGSLPPGVPDDFYARPSRAAKSAGARMVVDCSGEPLRAALEEGIYLIKPNPREFREPLRASTLHRLPDRRRLRRARHRR